MRAVSPMRGLGSRPERGLRLFPGLAAATPAVWVVALDEHPGVVAQLLCLESSEQRVGHGLDDARLRLRVQAAFEHLDRDEWHSNLLWSGRCNRSDWGRSWNYRSRVTLPSAPVTLPPSAVSASMSVTVITPSTITYSAMVWPRSRRANKYNRTKKSFTCQPPGDARN